MGGLTLNIEITLNNWINSLNTTSSLDIRVAPATRTRGEGGRRPPSPLVRIIIRIILKWYWCCVAIHFRLRFQSSLKKLAYKGFNYFIL